MQLHQISTLWSLGTNFYSLFILLVKLSFSNMEVHRSWPNFRFFIKLKRSLLFQTSKLVFNPNNNWFFFHQTYGNSISGASERYFNPIMNPSHMNWRSFCVRNHTAQIQHASNVHKNVWFSNNLGVRLWKWKQK